MRIVCLLCVNRKISSNSSGIEYLNTTIELAEPELNFGRRAIAKGAKGTPAETTDCGKTWTGKEIHIAASKYARTGRNYQVVGYNSEPPIRQAYSSIDVSLLSQRLI